MQTIKIMKLDENATLPKFAKQGDSGFDLYTLEDVTIMANETKLIKTGIAIDLQEGYEAQVRPRSGVSLNGAKGCFKYIYSPFSYDEHILTPSSPYLRVFLGTIDSGYKGDIGIITYNQENYDVLIPKGTRLAQCVVVKIPILQIEEVKHISQSQRGETGFGSSGIN
jgi:dUTP pyrophosphatase